MALSLTRKAKPNPEALYEAVTSFSAGNSVYRSGVLVRGDNPVVAKHFGMFMPAELDDLEKAAVRRDHQRKSHAQGIAERPQAAPPPLARPPSGKFRAVRSWTIPDPATPNRAILNAGTVVDASDPVYVRYPHLFEPEAGR